MAELIVVCTIAGLGVACLIAAAILKRIQSRQCFPKRPSKYDDKCKLTSDETCNLDK